MKRFASLNWKGIWPWVLVAAAAYFLAKQIVQ
jgi:hypothetical protein